jgi:integrase
MEVPFRWREEPHTAFRAWVRTRFRHAASGVSRSCAAWSQLVAATEANGRGVVDATADDVRAFLLGVANGAAPHVREPRRRRLLEVLALAFEDMRARGLRIDNPAQPLLAEFAAVARPLPVVLERARRDALALQLNRPAGGWLAERNRVLVLLVVLEGARPAKLAELRLGDIVERNGVLELTPLLVEGRKAANRLNRHTQDALRNWLRLRAELAAASDLLFPATASGARFRPADLYRLVRATLRRAGVETRNLSALDIRDCLGTRALARADEAAASNDEAPSTYARPGRGSELAA